jgi:hypothetical protein
MIVVVEEVVEVVVAAATTTAAGVPRGEVGTELVQPTSAPTGHTSKKLI